MRERPGPARAPLRSRPALPVPGRVAYAVAAPIIDEPARHGTSPRGVSAIPPRDTTRSGSPASALHSALHLVSRSADPDSADPHSAAGAGEFPRRVHALLRPDMRVLDLRAGHGPAPEHVAAPSDSPHDPHDMLDIPRRVASVVRIDVDATRRRRGAGATRVVTPGAPLPLVDASVDVVVADGVFEYVDDPAWIGRELGRVLRPGGWICARTPSRWGSIAVPDRLRRGGPPYRLNTRAALARYFPPEQYLHAVTPRGVRPVLLVFLRRYNAPDPVRQPRTAGVTVEENS